MITVINMLLTHYGCHGRVEHEHGIISIITIQNISNKQLTSYDYQSAWRMNMGPLAWSHPSTWQNVQLTHYNCQSRMKNELISMIIVISMPQCTTHLLQHPENNEEWPWNHQQDQSHQNAWMYNSLPMISRVQKSGHEIISMISHQQAWMQHTPTMISKAGRRMDHHCPSYQCTRIYNSPPMMARAE